MRKISLLAAALLIALSAVAQPAEKFQPKERLSVEQETKLKKILGDDLYTQWRSNHPMETPKLPEIKLQ